MKLSHFFNIINSSKNTFCDVEITSFEIYTSYLKKNSIYFLWHIGENAQRPLEIALKKGAYVVTSEKKYKDSTDPHIIYVNSVRNSLKTLAMYQRTHYKGHIIAVTGSVGKSSVKNMLSQILSMRYSTLYTLGNENAWLGIYCTLANIKDNTKFVVLETGASGPGSLSIPIQVVKPTISILLDVNFSHQEKYVNFTELLLEKASIIDNLSANGWLVISNQTYKKLYNINYNFRKDIKLITVDTQIDSDAFYKINNIELNLKNTTADIYSDSVEKIILDQANSANAINGTYAWVVMKQLGMSLDQFNSLIQFYKPLPRRFERLRVCSINGNIFELIDDAYNASPISALNAINSIQIRKSRRKILVFGDMLELGNRTLELHQNLFNQPIFSQFDKILLIGEVSHKCTLPFNADFVKNISEAYDLLQYFIEDGDLILLKASNSMNLYQLRKLLESNAIHVTQALSWFIENEYPILLND